MLSVDYICKGPRGEGLDWYHAPDGSMELRPAEGTVEGPCKWERARLLTRYILAVQRLAKEPGAEVKRYPNPVYTAAGGNTGPLVVHVAALPDWFQEEMQLCKLDVQPKDEHTRAVYMVPFMPPASYIGLRYA